MYLGLKDVTRRQRWLNLNAYGRLKAIEKGQGLKRGQKVVHIRDVLVVDARREPLEAILDEPDGALREGFPELTEEDFVNMYCQSYKVLPEQLITRIEFKHLLICEKCSKEFSVTMDQVQLAGGIESLRRCLKCSEFAAICSKG